MTLTKEQRQTIETEGQVPLTIDGIACVVVRADVFDRIKCVIAYDDSEMDPDEILPAVLEAWDAAGSPQDEEDYRL